jgi:selenocysteine lyase/cysteine desulfurase
MSGRSPDPRRALSSEFGPFDGRIWLNCAHQGPLPRPAQLAALEAIDLKRAPSRLSDRLFSEVPERLRKALARLLGADPAQIALTNSTSYGFNLLAQGLPWRAGEEILCVEGDFPATVLPWQPLQSDGVRIRLIDVPGARLTVERLAAEIGPRTRALCLSWVFSFFGHAIDLEGIANVCREHDVLLFVNGSQAVGARNLDVATLPIDGLSVCGFKWLCGPYATGFVWLSPRVLDALDYPNPHWLRLQTEAAASAGVDLTRRLDYALVDETSASAYDVFCAANFFNFMTWAAAVEHLLEVGVPRIEAHDQALVGQLIDSLPETFTVESPVEPAERSTLVLFSHIDRDRNSTLSAQLADHGIDIALRDGKLRVSPHLYNSSADIAAAIDILTMGRSA